MESPGIEVPKPVDLANVGQPDALPEAQPTTLMMAPALTSHNETPLSIVWDWVCHFILFAAAFLVFAAVTLSLHSILHWLATVFRADDITKTGINHVQTTLFVIDAIFFVGGTAIHTRKSMVRLSRV